MEYILISLLDTRIFESNSLNYIQKINLEAILAERTKNLVVKDGCRVKPRAGSVALDVVSGHAKPVSLIYK